jgi:undecaprenyl-diphosphatase
MIETLESIDRSLVIWVNSLHNPWLDEVMWIVSARITWIPFYLFLFFLAKKVFDWKKSFLFLITVIAAVGLSDFVSVQFVKELFLRYRPSHHADLTNILHFYEVKPGDFYKGGMYGFVSSHATNFAALSTITSLILAKNYSFLPKLMIFITLLVCFSRIYLGVHYLSDVIGGIVLGMGIAWLVYFLLWRKILKFDCTSK